MNYNTQSTVGMSADEIRMKRASLTRDLISLKEGYQKERAAIERIDLDCRYLARDKNQLAEDTESKRGRLRSLENEIAQMEKSLEEKNKAKKMALMELNQMQVRTVEIEGQMKSKEHEKEKWQDEMRDMSREIKKLEVQIREM